ncbi:MAG: ribosomal protein S18-alanine N-acetyltransferase [Myxococcales bacterium]|jgi:ribosomal-protein-alanine N-acetyltransferase
MGRLPAAPPRAPLILPARAGDLDAVSRIAEAVFPVPWPLSELAAELQRPHSVLRVLRPGAGQAVVAFLNHWRLGDELQVMNVATLPAFRGRGYGAALLQDAERSARARGLSAITLEVRRSNDDAIRLYERCGFQPLGVRPRYYSDNGEDALVMRLSLRS